MAPELPHQTLVPNLCLPKVCVSVTPQFASAVFSPDGFMVPKGRAAISSSPLGLPQHLNNAVLPVSMWAMVGHGMDQRPRKP